MRHKRFTTALLVGMLVAGLSACDDGDDAAAPATSSTSNLPTTTSIPALIEFEGAATFLSGTTAGFSIDTGTVTTDENGVSHTRDGTVRYRLLSDDPRVAGDVLGTWKADLWGALEDGAMIQWGTATLTNDGGTWNCEYAGAYASPVGDHISRWWRGTGGYEGLTFYMWMVPTAVGAATFEWEGVIFPGEPPPGAGG